MATQLVSLPMHLVQALLGADLCDKWFPDSHGIPSVFFERVHLSRSETAIAVVVLDPGLVWDNWGRHGRYGVSTILITSERNPAREYLPRPLPDELLAPVFEAVVSATRGSLTGHDALELYSELDAAQRWPNALPLPPLTRRPRTRFERRLRESAVRLQSCFASELDELRNDIKSYADALWRSGLGPAIGDLSTEGTLVDALGLRPSASEGCLESPGDFDSVVSLMNSVENARRLRDTTGWLLKELAPYGARPRQDLSAFHVTELYRRGFADRSPNYHAPLWRRTDSRYCEYPGTVHAAGIEATMLRLAAAFDQQLLADVDPVVKAGLCRWHFMRIQPFGRFDRNVAEMLAHVLLRQAGLPPSPLPSVMYRLFWSNPLLLESDFEQERCDNLLITLIAEVSEALRLGHEMVDVLDAERARLMDALADAHVPPIEAAAVTSDLLSNVMVRQWEGSDVSAVGQREYAFYCLHKKGLIDKIVAGDKVWWSLEATRQLAKSG